MEKYLEENQENHGKVSRGESGESRKSILEENQENQGKVYIYEDYRVFYMKSMKNNRVSCLLFIEIL